MTARDILSTYEKTGSIRATAKELGIGYQVVRRVLITYGVYASQTTQRVEDLRNSGKTIDDIARELHIGRNWAICNLPYTKGSYRIGEKTVNAQRIAESRKRRNKNND